MFIIFARFEQLDLSPHITSLYLIYIWTKVFSTSLTTLRTCYKLRLNVSTEKWAKKYCWYKISLPILQLNKQE